MKYVFLVVALIVLLPLAGWLRSNKQHVQKAWILVGFLPFGTTAFPHLYFAAISWPGWPGFVKGAEISVLDLLLVALYLGQPKGQGRLPFKASMAFYFIAVLVSALPADTPIATLFYLWQLARMFFAFMVIARACEDEQVIESILTGMVIGLGYEACDVIWQRFILGDVQTPGTFGHQNTLGMISHLVAFPLSALFLAGKKGWQPLAAPVTGIIVAVLTVSRATIGLAGFGYVALFVLSALRKWTPRLATIAVVAVLAIAAIAPFAASSFNRRFAAEPLPNAYDERAAFAAAAESMLADHPFGVGANNFVVVANSRGYFDRAGVAEIFESRSAHVHNAYLLAAAETGYMGALAFILMLLQPLIVAFRVGWRNRKDRRGDLLLGLGMALLLVYLQSFYEWTFYLFYTQYALAVTIGMVAGLAQQLKYGRRSIVPADESNEALANPFLGRSEPLRRGRP